MARPLRIEYSGACYHVMNRGNRRQTVFESESDVDLFLLRLGEFSEAYQVRVMCYCLMPNHFHLYIKTELPNLSKFMQAFLTSFTITKNRRDDSSGHVFQGRYKALLVEDDAYGAALSRYIHLNPVRTLAASELGIREKRKILKGSGKLNSYPALIGISKSPAWLAATLTLDKWGDTLQERRKNYSRYVESGLTGNLENPMEAAVAKTILGSESFVDSLRRGLTDISTKINLRRELGAKARVLSSVKLDDLLRSVATVYDVDEKCLLVKNSRNNEGRQVLLYLACKYCRGIYSLSELGERLGPITVGSLTRSRYNISRQLVEDRKLQLKIKRIDACIVKS